MKKLLLAFLLAISITSFSQPFLMRQYQHYQTNDTNNVWLVEFADNWFTLVPILEVQDTLWMIFYSDDIYMNCLDYQHNSVTPYSVVWTDSTGLLKRSLVSDLPITYQQIIDSLGFVPIESEIDGSVTNEIELPSQTGNAGKHLVTNGTSASWEAVKRQETYSGTTNGSGDYTVTFSTAYSVAPNIQFQIIGGTSNQTATCTVSVTGFTINVTQRNSVTVLGSEVLLANTSNVSGASVDVLITEK